jgi:hypothetical protein
MLLTILLTNFLGHAANAIIYFPIMNGYIDPSTGKYTVAGELVNYHPHWKPIGNLTIDIQLVDSNETVLAKKNVQVSKLLPLGEINVPYLVPIPFKAIFDDVDPSKVKYATEGAMTMSNGRYKPADLLLLHSEIYVLDSNEFGKKWGLRGEIKNNYTLPAKNVYVVASLYNVEGYFIGVAGLDKTDTHPVRIEPMQTARFFLSTWLPSDLVPAKAVFHAESEKSVLRNPFYFPLLPEHGMMDDENQWITSAHVGEKMHFRSNITNISRDNLEFYWILQIKKISFEDSIDLDTTLQRSVTEHIATIPYKVQAGESAPLDYVWMPEQEGDFFFEIFIWNNLENPIPLSHHLTDQFYTSTIFFVRND